MEIATPGITFFNLFALTFLDLLIILLLGITLFDLIIKLYSGYASYYQLPTLKKLAFLDSNATYNIM